MNPNNFTIKGQEAINQAFVVAKAHDNQAVETLHLLKEIGRASCRERVCVPV